MFKRAVAKPTLLIATMLLTTACTAKAPDTTTEVAVPAAASTVAMAATASTSAAADVAASTASPAVAAASTVASTATAAVAPAATPAGSAPVEGSDYTVIDTPDQPTSDKIEVTEVFGYGCPHCAAFQPHIAAWEKTLPADVHFSYLPAAFGEDPVHCWDSFARAFYAAQAMGVQTKSQDGIYKAVFDQHRVNGCPSIPALYSDYGVDPKIFASTMQSFAVSAKIAAAHEQVLRWGVDGTPTIVVDGKYRVIELVASGPDGMLRTVNWLIAKERSQRGKH